MRIVLAILAVLLLTASVTPRKPKEPRTPRTAKSVQIVRDAEGAPEPGKVGSQAHPSTPAPAPTAMPPSGVHGGTSDRDHGSPGQEGSGSNPGGGSIHERIATAWPGNDERILRIARCESNLNPRAVNPSSGTTGVLQVHPIWRDLAASMGYSWSDMKRVEPNVRVGWAVRERQGYGAWVCR